ncbi:hypothetical protein [Paenibacillus apiarius]|uniref:Uncharacterized protein n=1 Tax=Paenibacillus apiarius TaxID=46240 RepID=A0ABT4DVK2_9BACL|nr:hypothetical protein [Paenibacillus apiarius]MCY9513290.1 hypothetical protein [Paenibacillus apiarius]MCY9521351.1 hypothetical protein [Paenibacillus apiarius]MCY9555578.1 hypothetical protein [Paenibacillus apiarius]MCY9560706.1 hypothetical protein [Paenibacillus apiarius]MCY9685043.1 hypothetical protein [Paenibacillus apiarius]
MTYTLEQLREMHNRVLVETAANIIDYVPLTTQLNEYGADTSIPQISFFRNDAWYLMQQAIKHNPLKYVHHLADLNGIEDADTDGEWNVYEELYTQRNVALMLQSTPRQQTIASILTLQGQGGTGDE